MANEVDSLEIKVEASASGANKQLDILIAKLQNVSKSLNGINTSKISGIGTGTKTGNITKLGNSFKGLNTSIGNVKKSTHSLAYSFGKFYANCFLLIRGVKALGKAIGNSLDYVETFNYFNVTMDKIGKEFSSQYKNYGYDSAESYADSFSDRMNSLTTKMTGYNVGENGELTQVDVKNLSLDPEQIMNYQASISAVTNSLGLAGETSVNTSKALSMLAADMSSFKNVDLSTVMTNFQSGLIGQSRALYKYGIDITNATLQTYAYKYGVNMAVSEMTQADKMQLRLLAILDQSKVAWGDQANTINSVANQYRIFKQQISNLARIIGNLFLPIVQKVLPVVNALIIALQRLFSTLGVSLFGKSWLTDIMDGISSGYSDSGLDDLTDSAENTADALDNANKAAKELKTTTLGIDELNINNPQSDSSSSDSGSGSGTGGGVDLSDAIADALADYESIWDKALADSENKASEMADKICNAFKKHDYEGIGTYVGTGITNALNKIPWNTVYTAASNFGTGFAQFLNGLISPELFGAVGITIASSLNTAIYTSLSFAKTFDWENFGTSLANGVNDFFKTFDFVALAESINYWVQGIYTMITTAISKIKWSDVLKGIKDFLKTIDLDTVEIIIAAITIKKVGKWIISGGVWKLLKSTFGAGIKDALSVIGAIEFKTLGKDIQDLFKIAFGDKLGAVLSIVAGLVLIIGGAVTAVKNFFDMWKNGFSWLNEAFMVIGTALAALGAIILGVSAPVALVVAAIVAAVATVVIVVKEHWSEICDLFSKAAEWFDTNVITPICDFFKGLWESVSGFFSSLWTDISTIWSTVSKWFSDNVVEPVVGFFGGLFTRVGQIFKGLWIIIKAVWIIVSGWFKTYVTEPIKELFSALKDKVGGFFSALWTKIKEIWSTVSKWFSDNVTTPVKNTFSGLRDSIKGFFSSAWTSVKNVWKTVSKWFSDKIGTPIATVFDNVKGKITSAFDGAWKSVKSGVVSAMNAVISGVESAINWIVGGINNIIGGFNKVVKWAAKVADEDWGGVDLVKEVHLSRIDMYANGGMPNTGELFMARENGITEMVGSMGNHSAVANNDQIVEGIASGVESAVSSVLAPYLQQIAQNTKETANKDMSVNIGDKQIARANIRGQRAMGLQIRTT